MILFWVICALFVVIALSFVLPPLLQKDSEARLGAEQERREANIAIYKDQLSELENDLSNGLVEQQQYEQDREEIERRLLEDISTSGDSSTGSLSTRRDLPKRTRESIVDTSAEALTMPTVLRRRQQRLAYLVVLGIPIIAVLFYLKVGEIKGIAHVPTEAPAAEGPMQPGDRPQAQIEANVSALAKRLESNPADGDGWLMLARSYSSMERYPDAASAYEHAAKIKTNDADLLAEYAFATAMSTNKQLQGRPQELINQALKVDPANLKALELAGSAAYQAKEYQKAIDYWQKVVSKVPAGSEVAQSVNTRINEAKSLLSAK